MRLSSLALFACVTAQTAMADVCVEDATLAYPVSESVKSAAQFLDIQRYNIAPFTPVAQILSPTPAQQQERLDDALTAVQGILDQLKQPERDILVLGMLALNTHDDVPLFLLLFFDQAYAIPLYLDALERNGLNQHAAIIRRAVGLFGPPDTLYQTRYDMWLESQNGDSDPRLAARFAGLTERYNALPSPLDTALEILANDPATAAKYERFRQSTSDNYRYYYLTGQILACVDDASAFYTSLSAPDVAALPQPQQDIARLNVIGWEAADGGFQEYFASPIADDTMAAIALLEKHGLLDHADALRAGMAVFPTPFPQDAYTRELFIYDTMTEAEARAFNDMGAIFFEDGVRNKVIALAKDANLWPE